MKNWDPCEISSFHIRNLHRILILKQLFFQFWKILDFWGGLGLKVFKLNFKLFFQLFAFTTSFLWNCLSFVFRLGRFDILHHMWRQPLCVRFSDFGFKRNVKIVPHFRTNKPLHLRSRWKGLSHRHIVPIYSWMNETVRNTVVDHVRKIMFPTISHTYAKDYISPKADPTYQPHSCRSC